MKNSLRLQEPLYRKQIAFDLSEEKLDKYFPRPRKPVAERYYARAWDDISRYMTVKNFEHIQYSVYASKNEMTVADVNILVRDMASAMPWLCDCLNKLHVANIGEQHDLMSFISRAGIEVKKEKAK